MKINLIANYKYLQALYLVKQHGISIPSKTFNEAVKGMEDADILDFAANSIPKAMRTASQGQGAVEMAIATLKLSIADHLLKTPESEGLSHTLRKILKSLIKKS